MDLHTKAGISTLLDLLQHRGSEVSGTAHKTAFTYLQDGNQISGSLTFSELDRQARSVAAHLQEVTKPGDRVLLVYPPSLEYIIGFFGCVYAGVIAVPAPCPPNVRIFPMLQLIAKDAQSRIALSTSKTAEEMGGFQSLVNNSSVELNWLATDCLPDAALRWVPPDLKASDIAFLQYTSGTTGAPKGVMVSHANILANCAQSTSILSMTSADVVVSWLPQHHDFGLVAGILGSTYIGSHSIQFPPAIFLMRPYTHRLIHKFRHCRPSVVAARFLPRHELL